MQQYFISGAERFNYQHGVYESRCVVQVQYRTPKGKICTISIRDIPGLQAEFRKYASHNDGYGMILKPHEFVPNNSDVFSVTQFAVFTDDGRMLLGSETLRHWDIQFFVTKDFALQAGWIKPHQLGGEPADAALPPQPAPAQKPSPPSAEEMTLDEMRQRFDELQAITSNERTAEEAAELKRLAPIVSEYMKIKLAKSMDMPMGHVADLYKICLSYDKKQINWDDFKERAHALGERIGHKALLVEVAEAAAEKCRANGLAVTIRHIEHGFDGIDGFWA